MDAILYTRLHSNLATEMDRVCNDYAPIIVTRKASSSVVMISLDDYEALKETAYLLRSPKNALRLLESIAALERGAGPRERVGRVKLVFSQQVWGSGTGGLLHSACCPLDAIDDLARRVPVISEAKEQAWGKVYRAARELTPRTSRPPTPPRMPRAAT